MELAQIVSQVTEQLGQTSLSQRTIQEIVGLNPVAQGQEPDQEYFTRVVSMLRTMNGQLSHDIAAQVEQYKKQNPIPTPAPTPMPAPTPTPNPIDPQIQAIQALTEQVAKLQKTQEEAAQAAVIVALRTQIKAEMQKQGAANEGLLDMVLASADIKADKTADEQAKSLLDSYDQQFTKIMGQGIAPRNPQGNQGKADSKALDRFFEAKRKKMGLPPKS